MSGPGTACFAGVDGPARMPDEATILRFRNLL